MQFMTVLANSSQCIHSIHVAIPHRIFTSISGWDHDRETSMWEWQTRFAFEMPSRNPKAHLHPSGIIKVSAVTVSKKLFGIRISAAAPAQSTLSWSSRNILHASTQAMHVTQTCVCKAGAHSFIHSTSVRARIRVSISCHTMSRLV